MTMYTIQFIKSEDIARDTKKFYFTKPEDFEYKAGQSVDFTFLNPTLTDERGNTRTFSLASSPTEKEIAFAVRVSDSAFKQNLLSLKEGDEMEMTQPMGSFTLHARVEKSAVFFAGGIGVTPVRSIIRNYLDQKFNHRINVFLINRKEEDIPFWNELKVIDNPNIKFIPVLTKDVDSVIGEKGYPDESMITKYIENKDNVVYYISGPLRMVTGMQKTLEGMGILDDDIRTEEFPGY